MSSARPAVVEKGQEVETVCCLPIREAATSSDAWAMLTRERLVLKSLAQSGPNGVSGLSVQSLVVGEFRYEQICRSRELAYTQHMDRMLEVPVSL